MCVRDLSDSTKIQKRGYFYLIFTYRSTLSFSTKDDSGGPDWGTLLQCNWLRTILSKGHAFKTLSIHSSELELITFFK